MSQQDGTERESAVLENKSACACVFAGASPQLLSCHLLLTGLAKLTISDSLFATP